MSRPIFLTIASFIALSVGAFALLFPGILLESKGVVPLATTSVWMRETGLLLFALGIINFAVRKLKPSGTLKALLSGNIIIQIGLFVIELLAYSNDVITKLSGIIPNLILHILLATGFVYFLKTMNLTTDNAEPK